MAITSTVFVFFFLPISLMVYYLVGNTAKKYVLLAISLLFYACGSLQYLILFALLTIANVCIGRVLSQIKTKSVLAKILLVFGVLLNVFILCYYKYTDFGLSIFGRIFNVEITARNIVLPLGISFFTFKAISYLADIYNGKAELQENPVHDLLYLYFFAQVQSGPLSRYNEMNTLWGGIPYSGSIAFEYLSNGIYRFLIGFGKKIILSNVLYNITSEIFAADFANVSTGYLWLGSICYSMQLFFDFAGYSDMAIGISKMFGYDCMENFNYPYMTESVSKFWRRWHISLSSWFRDYVYIPLGGSRCKTWRVYLNLFVVWTLTGVWHGAAWNFIAWGIGFFILIAFEKATKLPDRIHSKIGKGVYRVFTLLFINFEWVLFNSKSLMDALRYIKRMIFYTPNALSDRRTLFLLKDNWFFILIGLVLCFPVVSWIEQKLSQKTKCLYVYHTVLEIIIFAAAVWAMSFVISGQNNPFAYANF